MQGTTPKLFLFSSFFCFVKSFWIRSAILMDEQIRVFQRTQTLTQKDMKLKLFWTNLILIDSVFNSFWINIYLILKHLSWFQNFVWDSNQANFL